MNLTRTLHRLAAATTVAGSIFFIATAVSAQSMSELNSMLSQIQGQMSEAESNTATGKEAVEKLDKAEALFAQIASSPKSDKSELPSAYQRLDSMLNRLY